MNVLADVPALHGSLVRLEPLSMSHGEDLAAAAEEDRGAYGFTHVPRGREVAPSERALMWRQNFCFLSTRPRPWA